MPKLSADGYMVRYQTKHGPMLAWSLGMALMPREARERFKAQRIPKGKTWLQAYRQGCRVVRVRTKEI